MPRDNRDKDNGRKRRYSDVLEDPYKGPQEFMEAGTRGFLITSIPDREEHSIDETLRVLRKTCVKLYGGIKPLKREDASFSKGYILVDFMDPENIVCLPHPDAEKVAEEEKAKDTEAATKEGEGMDEDNKQAEEEKQEGEASEDTAKAEDGAENTTEEGKEAKDKEETEDEKKKKEDMKKKEEDRKPLMMASHKFQGYRTELRNIMFVKSDIPDPAEVLSACFEMMLERKPLFTDCVNQLLPVQGVCDNDYKQLEIMCRRVLVPYVGEHLEEPPSFGVMLVNKMCEPGTEVLLEVVRSAIWCLNPCAWQCSPWTEPSVVIHLEIIGSKIILSAMPHYMKYRQYSPFAVYELGKGKPEIEEHLLKEKPEGYRTRGCRGGRRKDKNRNREDQNKDQEKENKEEGGEKDAGEEVQQKEDTEQTGQPEEGKQAEQPTETQVDDKEDGSDKTTPTKTRGSKSKS